MNKPIKVLSTLGCSNSLKNSTYGTQVQSAVMQQPVVGHCAAIEYSKPLLSTTQAQVALNSFHLQNERLSALQKQATLTPGEVIELTLLLKNKWNIQE